MNALLKNNSLGQNEVIYENIKHGEEILRQYIDILEDKVMKNGNNYLNI